LDVIHKEADPEAVDNMIQSAASTLPPLHYKKADNEDPLEKMKDYALRYHVLPSRGQALPEALYEALKDKFGPNGIVSAGGREVIIDMLKKLSEEHKSPNAADNLPTYDGTPILVRHDYDPKDRGMFMTRETGGSPGSYM
jgi:hypothetical protein